MTQDRIARATQVLATMAAVAAVALSALPASAQTLSAPSFSNSSSANEATASSDNPSYQRFSATQTLSSSASSFQTRYFGNASADCGPACGSRTETLNSNYTVSWTATAPNIYSMTIATRRTAGLTIDDEGSDGAQATMGALGCTPSGGTTTSGNCTLGDPVDNFATGADTDVNVNQTNSLTRCGQSLGSPVNHSVNFTWTQTAFTPATGFIQVNMDSAAVRLGSNNLDASNAAADYPGFGGRTQSNDGHFVTVSITNLCGNGSIDTCGVASEQCDDGALNGTAGSCCTTSCTFKANGTACTDDGNVCTNDTCNGASAVCQHPNNTAPCSDGLFCNGGDTCSGGSCVVHTGNPCPGPDGDANCSESCNEATDTCNAPDPNGSACVDGLFCNGPDTCSGGACTGHAGDPCTGGSECADACNESVDNCFDLAGTACTSDGETCTADECDGSGTCAHPAGNAGTICRTGSGDLCDTDEACDGSSPTCPPDSVSGAFVACRPVAGDCDVAENCTGIAGQPCPPDAVEPNTTVCRPSAGDCDVADTCDGSGVVCPADAKSTAECRAPAGICDLAESCDGVNDACPPDVKSTAVCRPSAGDCDVAESCNGLTDTCPADGFASSSTVCRPSTGTCDIAETCTGSGPSCPADTGLPDTDGDTVCDAIDNCDAIPNTSQDNNDSDPLGDACDPCTNIVPTVASKQKLTLTKLLAPATDDKLSFGSFFTAVPTSPVIDPLTNGIRFLVVDSTGATPIDVTIGGGAYSAVNKAGWKVNGSGTSWTYKNSGTVVPLVNGIQKVQLKGTSTPGKYKVGVKGKNGDYVVNTANLPLVGTIVIDVPFASGGQCGEATFPAVAPAKPSCVSVGGGKTVKCK